MDRFKWIWSYIKKYKWKMIIAMFIVLLTSILDMVNPQVAGKIVDDVIYKSKKELLVPLIAVIITVTIVKSLIRFAFQMIFENVSQDIIFQIREELYKKIHELDFDFFNNNRTGDIMARMTGDVETVRHFIAWVIYNVFQNLMIFIFAIVMMLRINVTLTLSLIAITPVIGFLAYKMTMEVGPTFHEIRESFSKLNSVVQENISGNRVVKAFAKENYEIKKFQVENENYMNKNIESARIWEKYLPVLDSLAGMLSVIMIFVGGFMVIDKQLTLGQLVVFNGFIWALNNPMRMAGWLINDIQRFLASADKIEALLQTEPNIKVDQGKSNKKIGGDIKFNNVSFSYGDEPVLKSVSIHIKPGETVGIIGPTGSGKSTLVNLICRFYDATEGTIYIDGVDIRNINIRSLRENIGVAMQDTFLFSDTIEGNIAYGMPKASLDQVKSVASIADANNFIENMPEGYDTIIGERGVGLSGGQRQRIALARALLKNTSILILDDTTSSVDMETEMNIQKKLNSKYGGKTSFIIAHRISSVKNADIILVLDKGEIIERGTHEELIAKKDYYYNVYKNQLGDFDRTEEAI